MNSERPLSSNEYKPDDLTYPIDTVADALSKADPPQEGYIWLAQVLKGELPGEDIAYNIALLERIQFSPNNTVDPRIERHVAEALDLLRTKYRADIENTTQELNAFIAARPGVLVVSGTGGAVVSLSFQYDNNRTLVAELNTTTGPIVVVGGTQVCVDITRLSPEDQTSIHRYERQYGL